MTTQYSPILKLALPVQGELSGTWGDVVNDNITSMVEQAIAGRAVIDTWTVDSHTLTTANGTTSESRCAMLELTDTGVALTGAGTVICPTASKIYIVKNASGQNITVKTSAGTGILVPNGRTTFLFCDGTNVVEAMTHTTSLQLGTSTVVTAVLDEDNMASDSATSLATQQSIKAYVDSQVTAQDLDFAGGTGTGSVDLDSQTFTVAGTANEIETSASGQTVTVGLPNAVTIASLTATTADINGGTIDGVTMATSDITVGAGKTLNVSAGTLTLADNQISGDKIDGGTIGSVTITTADINGGTIDGTVIGGTTAAAGTFTTGTFTTGTFSNDAEINGITVGRGAGDVSSNTASGYRALFNNTTGIANTANGREALQSNTTGGSNTASGYQALFSNTTGSQNTASGREALQSNTTGNFNTASGYLALQSNTEGGSNTASGFQALLSNTTGNNNTASGRGALQSNTTGNSNTASGFQALQSNTTGVNNTASGTQAILNNTTGFQNTAVGYLALQNNTTGAINTAVGMQALKDITTGNGNLGLAFRTGGATYSPVFNPTTENNRIVMGHTGITNAYVQVAWTVVSDARDKAAFAPVPHGLDFVKSLKPTEYQFKENGRDGEADGIKRYGFLAQDVLELEGDNPVIVDTEDLDKLKLKESNLIPVLVNAIQDQQKIIETLEGRITALENN